MAWHIIPDDFLGVGELESFEQRSRQRAEIFFIKRDRKKEKIINNH